MKKNEVYEYFITGFKNKLIYLKFVQNKKSIINIEYDMLNEFNLLHFYFFLCNFYQL